jgi:Uma2 family endonuclease
METLVKHWTYEALVEHFPPETPCEIIENELFMSPAPNTEHQDISGELEFLLRTFCKKNQLGKIYDAPFDVIVDENNVVQPDIIFISNQNLEKLTKRGFEGVPDLVVEIISPSTFYRDSYEKKDFYEKIGVKEYWLIEPANRVIEVFVLENGKYQLHSLVVEKGTAQSKILEGFEAVAKEIFPERKEQ